MTMSETIGAIAPALVKAQAEIKPITKDSTNPAFRSKYTSLDAIMEVVRPVLAKNGLIVVQSGWTPSTVNIRPASWSRVVSSTAQVSGSLVSCRSL